MSSFTARTRVPVPASGLFDWHARPGAFERLTPPWQPVSLERFEGIEDGDRAAIRLGVGPASVRWVAEHRGRSEACRTSGEPCQFEDVQVSGPFASWHHRHRMIPDGSDASVLEDHVEYRLPLAPLSTALGSGLAREQLGRMFAYRHRVTREDLRRHAESGLAPMTVAVTGASGLVGSALCALLTTGGHRVVRLVRSRSEAVRLSRGPAERAVYWNVETSEVDQGALALAAPDAVVHLAGEPVLGVAYTAEKKRRIWESRTKGTLLLARALGALSPKPRVVLSASASGIYGDRGPEPLDERSATGDGFLADVCRAWEATSHEVEAIGIRTVQMRIGIVQSPAGGMLRLMAPPARAGLIAWPGDGAAFWPWIALDDVLYAILHLLAREDLSGPFNLSAPAPATSKSFARTLGRVLHRPAVLGVPGALVRAVGGQMADDLALKSVRMIPSRLRASGFTFAYPTLDGALGHVLGHAPPPGS